LGDLGRVFFLQYFTFHMPPKKKLSLKSKPKGVKHSNVSSSLDDSIGGYVSSSLDDSIGGLEMTSSFIDSSSESHSAAMMVSDILI
jgi:hypothetical protein